MAELTSTKLNAETHLLLDQPLLRLPHELARKNHKTSQRLIERERDYLLQNLPSLANHAVSDGSVASSSLNTMITRMQGLKRKLEALHGEEQLLHKQSRARIAHLAELYTIPSLADVKYDEWSRVRLDRLLADYLLRSGYSESAKKLSREKEIEDLVDADAFVQCQQIEASLRKGRTQEALAWCMENKQSLKKMNLFLNLWQNDLEFQLRLQQYIELVRNGDAMKLTEATTHARKYLAHQTDNFSVQAAGMLIFAPETFQEPYKSLYAPDRWDHLAQVFLQTHHALFALPSRPLLHIALSAGLSALKTPSCHSAYASSSSNASSSTTSVCPICSTELNELARNVPYAHHTKSYVESDPVVLPNGRIYGRERLRAVNEKLGTEKGVVRDPTDFNALFKEEEVKKVFIS